MPRSDEAQAFFNAVYRAVQEIPPGKVTTYGHIAMLVGTPEGVTVTTGALGELMVDFGEFGWFPKILPSEAARGMVLSDEDEGDEGGEEEDEGQDGAV
ncbi:Ras guanine nucleotide exchange factor bud5 [Collariella sp. IMI 366227]|nr:Ras guanine nucleotide exchange factor bud5 [Collariella sp. IMI 366227]